MMSCPPTRGKRFVRAIEATPLKLLFVHGDAAYRRAAAEFLRRGGVLLRSAANTAEARQLVQQWKPNVLFLEADVPGESGYLACAKIKAQMPEARVFLVGSRRRPCAERFARFVGAEAVVQPDDDFACLLDQVLTTRTDPPHSGACPS